MNEQQIKADIDRLQEKLVALLNSDGAHPATCICALVNVTGHLAVMDGRMGAVAELMRGCADVLDEQEREAKHPRSLQ